ncbi:MAG: AAA family ATPase [candidate division NC10 bacterium]
MILRSISVANWRCFLEAVELGPFADGLNIVYAPNGTGKSTLFEAMRCALLDGHRVSGRDVDELRPWGRSLAPKVTVEFVHGGTEYRITKQFLDNQSAFLERKENGRFRPLAEGASADEQTRAILTQNPPGRGLAQVRNWGFAQVLWAPQGNLSLSSLSEDLVTDIRSMLSAQVSGSGTDPIERKIEEHYLEFYTPTGKSRTGREAPRLAGLERELEDAHDALREALSLYQAFDDASRRVEDLRASREQSRLDVQEITKALGEARQRAEAYRALLAEKDRRLERAKAAEAQHNQLKQRISLIQQTEKGLSEARKAVATIEAEIPLKAREAQERAKEAERTRAALEDARKGRKDVDDAEQSAEQARRFAEGAKARAELDALIERIHATQQLLAERKQRRSELVAPDAKVLRALRKAIKERDEAQVRLEASLITLEVATEKDGRLDVVAGERTGWMLLSAGVSARIQGSPEVVAVIPGVARLRASGPTGSTEEYRTACAEADKNIGKLTAPYGSHDIDSLETLVEKATQMEAEISEAETLYEGRKISTKVSKKHK